MATVKASRSKFRVGDFVTFRYGTGMAFAQVTEDRGTIGVKGRRLYQIRRFTEDGTDRFEVSEDDLSPLGPPDPTGVRAYLEAGGLLEILGTNAGGGKNPPSVWLTYTPRDTVTHTLTRSRGLIGGQPAPAFALHNGKIFKPKVDEVIAFLTTFGLTERDAQAVIAAVGTSS